MSDRAREYRVYRFGTVDDVVREMGEIYMLARYGEMEVEKAGKLFRMLDQIRASMEIWQLERRIEALEARIH